MLVAEQGVGLVLVQLCRAHRSLVASALAGLHVHVGQEHVVYRWRSSRGSRSRSSPRRSASTPRRWPRCCAAWSAPASSSGNPDPADTRLQRVYLTPGGTKLVRSVIDIWTQLRPGSRPGWPRPSRRSCAVCCCRCLATSPRRGRDGLDDGYDSAK